MPRRRLPQPPLDPLADLPSARWWRIAKTIDPDADCTAPGYVALLALLHFGAPKKFVEKALHSFGDGADRETAKLLRLDPAIYRMFLDSTRHVGTGEMLTPRVDPPFSNRKSGKRRRQSPRPLMGPGWWRDT